MSSNGIKISDMVYSSLGDAVSDSAQIPLAVVINSEKLNRRIPISEVKGYQGDRGYQGNQGSSGGSGFTGSGTATHHAMWTGTTALGDSDVIEDAGHNIIFNAASTTIAGTSLHNIVKNGSDNIILGDSLNNEMHGSGNALTDVINNQIHGSYNTIPASSSENHIIGDSNVLETNVNETQILGNNNRIRAYASQSQIMGHANDITGPDNIIIGDDNTQGSGSGELIIIGNDNRADDPEAMIFGTDNSITGGGGDSKAVGHLNILTNTSTNMVFGNQNTANGTSGVSIFGNNITVDSTDNNPNGVHLGIGNQGILHIHGRLQGADNAYADTGKIISFDANGEMIIVDPIATPAGVSGDLQYNNSSVMAGSGQSYTNTEDGTQTSWKINRLLWKTPAADTKTVGVSRISYLNAALLMLYNSSGGIEIANNDSPTRTTYGIFASSYSHIRNFGATYRTASADVDAHASSDIVVDGSIILLTGTTVTSAVLKLTALVTSADTMYTNTVVKIVNHSVADISCYGFTIATNTTCDLLWLGNGLPSGGTGGSEVFTLLGRYANV